MTIQLCLQRFHYAKDNLVQIDRLSFLATLSEQGANAVDHFAARTVSSAF
jgi:hypothetical protein